MIPITESCNYNHTTQASSPLTVWTGAGVLQGIFVASASATPTVAVKDGATTIVNTFTPTAGTFVWLPATFATSLVVTLGGTVDCTIFWSNQG